MTALTVVLVTVFAVGFGTAIGYSAALVRLPRTLASMTLDELKQLDDRVRAVRRVLVAKGKVLPNSPAPPVPRPPELHG